MNTHAIAPSAPIDTRAPARARPDRAEEKRAPPAAQVRAPASPLQLTIELDKASARFVQMLIAENVVVRRYPDETQLAFSRGIRAYEEAKGRV